VQVLRTKRFHPASRSAVDTWQCPRRFPQSHSPTDILSLQQGTTCPFRFDVYTALSMKNAVFWDVMPCGFRENRGFVRTYRLHHQGDKNRRARNNVSSNYQTKARCEVDKSHMAQQRKRRHSTYPFLTEIWRFSSPPRRSVWSFLVYKSKSAVASLVVW
jgi:hypothetical protein